MLIDCKRTKVQVEDASLAHILDLAACLADLGGLDTLAATRLPRKYREWPRADFAFLPGFVMISTCTSNDTLNN